MAFLGCFNISASGMSAQRMRMDIAAENIANIDTTRTAEGGPYRRKNVVLESYGNSSFDEALRKAAAGGGIASSNAGVRVAGIVEDDRDFKRVYDPSHPDADTSFLLLAHEACESFFPGPQTKSDDRFSPDAHDYKIPMPDSCLI